MSLELKRPDKELWDGVTKEDLARHYLHVAPWMLPHTRDRPLSLVRAPNGIDAHRFYQKDAHHLDDDLELCPADETRHVMARRPEDLVLLADQACVELHGWVTQCTRPEQPDRIVFDLDPPDAEDFDTVRNVAARLYDLLAGRGAAPHPMLTGSKGIHVTVPLVPSAHYPAVSDFCNAVAEAMVRHDDRLTTQLRKAKRQGRIFVDTLRNRPRQTAVLPWSTRARAGAPVATPITRDDLDDPTLDPQRYCVGQIPAEDPWPTFFKDAVPLATLT